MKKAGGLAVGAQRRASIFRFRSAHWGKSFGIAADAEMTDVLPGVWFGSLASIYEYHPQTDEGKSADTFLPIKAF